MTTNPGLLLGAYAMSPSDSADEETSIHDEIAAILAAGSGSATSTPGLGDNWGRSPSGRDQ